MSREHAAPSGGWLGEARAECSPLPTGEAVASGAFVFSLSVFS
jgi:hypothetical protein